MAVHGRSARGETTPGTGLLILTGASHTGKTTVARAILDETSPPAAFLSVDETLERTLWRPPGDIWSNIPLAYEIIQAEARVLLGQRWFVVVESTFTYVDATGAGEFHDLAVERLAGEATRIGALVTIVQLRTPLETALARARSSGRLDASIVAETVALHQSPRLPLAPKVIETDQLDPAAAAAVIREHLRAGVNSER